MPLRDCCRRCIAAWFARKLIGSLLLGLSIILGTLFAPPNYAHGEAFAPKASCPTRPSGKPGEDHRALINPHGVVCSSDHQGYHALKVAQAQFDDDIEIGKKLIGTCRVGGQCTFEVAIRNVGKSVLLGPFTWEFEDVLPIGWQFLGIEDGAGVNCNVKRHIFKCKKVRYDNLSPPGGFFITYRVQVPSSKELNIKAGEGMEIKNCVTLTKPGKGNGNDNPDNDKACPSIKLSPQPPIDIAVEKTGPKYCYSLDMGSYKKLYAGKNLAHYNCEWEIRITNLGYKKYEGNVIINDENYFDLLGAEDYFKYNRPPLLSYCDFEPARIACRLGPETIEADHTKIFTVKGILAGFQNGQKLSNCATVHVDGEPFEMWQNNKDCHEVTVVTEYGNVEITKSSGVCSPKLGVCTFAIHINNNSSGLYLWKGSKNGVPEEGSHGNYTNILSEEWSEGFADWSLDVAEAGGQAWVCGIDKNDKSKLACLSDHDIYLQPGQTINLTVVLKYTGSGSFSDEVENCAGPKIYTKGYGSRVMAKPSCVHVHMCPTGTTWSDQDDKCVASDAETITSPLKPTPTQPPTSTPSAPQSPESACPGGQVLQDGRCVPPSFKCWRGQVLQDGRCVPRRIECPRGQVPQNGRCVPRVR